MCDIKEVQIYGRPFRVNKEPVQPLAIQISFLPNNKKVLVSNRYLIPAHGQTDDISENLLVILKQKNK